MRKQTAGGFVVESSLPNSLNRQGTTPPPMAFDLDAYCDRINYTGSRDPTLATLRGLHFAHAHNVPFENLDIHLGQAISLQPADLFTKIVTRKRGGYCYEVNSFFAMILRAFGFQVHGLLARVLFSNLGLAAAQPSAAFGYGGQRAMDRRCRFWQLLPARANASDARCGERARPGQLSTQNRCRPHLCFGSVASRALARPLRVYPGTIRSRRLRAVQLLELDISPCAFYATEALYDSHKRGTYSGGRYGV